MAAAAAVGLTLNSDGWGPNREGHEVPLEVGVSEAELEAASGHRRRRYPDGRDSAPPLCAKRSTMGSTVHGCRDSGQESAYAQSGNRS